MHATARRYVMYGAVCAKVAEEMRKPEVAGFFAKLIQRTSPKSWAQAMTELVVTRRFFENFSGDQVRGGGCTSRLVAGDNCVGGGVGQHDGLLRYCSSAAWATC